MRPSGRVQRCETKGGKFESGGNDETNEPGQRSETKRGVFPKRPPTYSAKVKEGEREGRRQGGRGLHSAKSGEILSPDTPMWLIYSHIGISTLENFEVRVSR